MIYDLIIIGADIAGLTAGIYAGRKKIKATIVTKQIGGQSFYAGNIENYPGFLSISGLDFINQIKKQVEHFKVPIAEEKEVTSVVRDGDLFLVKTILQEYRTKSVIIASGKHPRSLNVPGEEQFMGRGVSVCAICDAPFFQNKDVAVVGGGNAAFDSAYDLLKYADKIYILQHGDKFIGDQNMYETLKASGKVQFLTKAETKEIKGDKPAPNRTEGSGSGFVETIVYEDLKTGEIRKLKVNGVFINIGQIPNSSFVEGLVELNKRKEIIIDHKTGSTSVEGIFAAGDVTDGKYKQLIIAASEGAIALLSASSYLREKYS